MYCSALCYIIFVFVSGPILNMSNVSQKVRVNYWTLSLFFGHEIRRKRCVGSASDNIFTSAMGRAVPCDLDIDGSR